MLRQNRANLPNPGNNPGQTVQNAANHNAGSREQSKARRFSKKTVAVFAAGAAFLGAGTGLGEFLGHSPSIEAGPNRTQQLQDKAKANMRDFHCLVGSYALGQAGDNGARITLTLRSGNGPSARVTYGMAYESAPGQFATAGHLDGAGGDDKDYTVAGTIAPEAMNKPFAIYAIGGSAADVICGSAFGGETLTAHTLDSQGQPLATPELDQTPQGDFPNNLPTSVLGE